MPDARDLTIQDSCGDVCGVSAAVSSTASGLAPACNMSWHARRLPALAVNVEDHEATATTSIRSTRSTADTPREAVERDVQASPSDTKGLDRPAAVIARRPTSSPARLGVSRDRVEYRQPPRLVVAIPSLASSTHCDDIGRPRAAARWDAEPQRWPSRRTYPILCLLTAPKIWPSKGSTVWWEGAADFVRRLLARNRRQARARPFRVQTSFRLQRRATSGRNIGGAAKGLHGLRHTKRRRSFARPR